MLDTVIPGRCEVELQRIGEGQVHLVCTSPPYNVGIEYGNGHDDNLPELAYYTWVEQWLAQCYRVLCEGGRIAIDIPNVGNTQYSKSQGGLQTYVDKYWSLLRKVGFTPREQISWVKAKREDDELSFCGSSTAWGSFLSPNNPQCRSFSETILVAHKGSPSRGRVEAGDITNEEFLRYTRNVWTFPAESKRKHPAPFPEELPYRLIKLYTWSGDVVLDPFSGTGTTALVAAKTGRHFIGIEQSPLYVEMSIERIQKFLNENLLENVNTVELPSNSRQSATRRSNIVQTNVSSPIGGKMEANQLGPA